MRLAVPTDDLAGGIKQDHAVEQLVAVALHMTADHVALTAHSEVRQRLGGAPGLGLRPLIRLIGRRRHPVKLNAGNTISESATCLPSTWSTRALAVVMLVSRSPGTIGYCTA